VLILSRSLFTAEAGKVWKVDIVSIASVNMIGLFVAYDHDEEDRIEVRWC